MSPPGPRRIRREDALRNDDPRYRPSSLVPYLSRDKQFGTKPMTAAKQAKNRARAGKKPVLLSGGNPQIAKADGDAPVQAIYRGHAGLEKRRRTPP